MTIEINVANKIAKLKNKSDYAVCSNTDYIIHFNFDAEWNEYDTKTARFKFNGKYIDVVFSGTDCNMPVIENTKLVEIGVYAGELHTTTAAYLTMRRSILSGNGCPADPIPDVYEQIINLLNQKENKHPYLSLERLENYLYKITFDVLPEIDDDLDANIASCSSYVANGKMYRNLDWNYAETAEFRVITKKFKGMSFINGLNDSELDDDKLRKLPYQIVDGVNDYGIMIATHVLFNDWDFAGCGSKSVNLINLPFLILNNITSLDDFSSKMTQYTNNIKVPDSLINMGYLLQFIVSDGERTYVIVPPEDKNGNYVVLDATENPKLANFRWINRKEVSRTDPDMQLRPTGIERFNQMPCDMKELRYTKIYETPDYLSDFIGMRNTTKDSTDEQLLDIFDAAHKMYEDRTRDGQTWQTVHSVVYSPYGIEKLYIQERFDKEIKV